MAKFTSNKVINTRWRNNDFIGAAGSSHTFADALYDEFLVDWAYQINLGDIVITETPTTGNIQMSTLTVGNIVLTGTATGNFGGGGSGNSTVYYQTTQPTGGTYAAGDLWVDSDAYLPSPGTSSSITVSAPIINSGTSTNAALSIQSASTTAAGVVQLTDSTSTTSSTLAATATAVKAAKDAADAKVATVSGTAPITTSGTTAITVAVNAGSTSAAGVLQLTDSTSSTSTTTAATPNAVLQSTKNYQNSIYASTTRIGNMPYWAQTTSLSSVSGRVIYSKHIPERNFTVSNLSFINTTASSGLTLCRFGIYTRSGTTFTLVARTASDTTLFNTANTRYTRALDTTGGYPATYDFVAGNEYWVSYIQVGTTVAPILSSGSFSTAQQNAFVSMTYQTSTQTDLPTSATGSTSTTTCFCEVS